MGLTLSSGVRQTRSDALVLSREFGAGLALLTGTLLNFLVIRIWFLALDPAFFADQVLGVPNDFLTASAVFLASLPFFLLIRAAVRGEAASRRLSLALLAGASLALATATWVGFFYYFFAGGYLSVTLLADYLPQLGFLMESIRSEDFDLRLLAMAVACWLGLVAAVHRWGLPMLRTARRRILWPATVLAVGAASLLGPDPATGSRSNIVYYLVTGRGQVELGEIAGGRLGRASTAAWRPASKPWIRNIPT